MSSSNSAGDGSQESPYNTKILMLPVAALGCISKSASRFKAPIDTQSTVTDSDYTSRSRGTTMDQRSRIFTGPTTRQVERYHTSNSFVFTLRVTLGSSIQIRREDEEHSTTCLPNQMTRIFTPDSNSSPFTSHRRQERRWKSSPSSRWEYCRDY